MLEKVFIPVLFHESHKPSSQTLHTVHEEAPILWAKLDVKEELTIESTPDVKRLALEEKGTTEDGDDTASLIR